MNNKEFINALKLRRRFSLSLSAPFNEGYRGGINFAIDLATKIDEPEKVIVPRHVAEMIEVYHEEEISLAFLMKYFKGWHDEVQKLSMDSDAIFWIVNNLEDFVMAWVNGYEVEKEQLYYVDFINDGDVHKRLVLDNENGKYNIVDWSENLIGLVQEMFTESDIKKVNPDFMSFAVKVED